MKLAICTLVLFFALGMNLQANNLQISAVTVTNGGATLEFTISWDNSWRVQAQPANHDAVWLIVKRRDCASIDYRHQNVSSTLGDHSFGAPLTATTTTDKKGLFIHRATPGQGNIVSVPVTITLDNPPAGEYDYKVVGIEMVLVPSGAFYVGDSTTASGVLSRAVGTINPFPIISEAAIPVGQKSAGAGFLTSNTTNTGTATSALGAAYPKGFNAFYAMKYEISLGQFLDFLNSANGAAGSPALHGYTTPVGGRNPVTGNYPFYTTTTPNRACGGISWAGLLAYLDWAALAPMTELEYEKLCRGLNSPVAGEFATSTTSFTDINTLISDGTPMESTDTTTFHTTPINVGNDGNHLGPYRVGFATTANTTLRVQTGGSYYGAMELTGNVAERAVAIWNSATHSDVSNYNGSHGDGEISGSGFSDQGWPAQSTVGANEDFAAVRGGAWNMLANQAMVSYRGWSFVGTRNTNSGFFGRAAGLGGRGVRRAVSGTSTF